MTPTGTLASLFGWALWALICSGLLVGCEVQGVSVDGSQQASSQDGGEAAANEACEPGESVCDEGNRRVCDEDGELELRRCESGTTCQEGACVPIESQCPERAEDGVLTSFSLSHSGELTFPLEPLGPETEEAVEETRTLRLENCGDSLLYVAAGLSKDANPFDDNQVGASAFEIADDATRYREVAPGESTSYEITYRPRHTLSHDPGTLELDVLGDESRRRVDIDLVPQVECLTATPRISLTELTRTHITHIEEGVFLQNCGTEPIQPDGIDIAPSEQASAQAVHIEPLESDPVPLVVHPGEDHWIPLRIAPREGGWFDYQVGYGHGNDSEELTTDIVGYAADDDCRDDRIAPPTISTRDGEGTRLPSSEEDWQHQARPGERVEFALPEHRDTGSSYVVRLEAPDGSRATLDRSYVADATRGDTNGFRPDVAGTYRIFIDHIDADHRPLCNPPDIEFEVVPRDDLYVDLNWHSRAGEVIDPIESDVGYNRGVDLNLHIAATDSLDEETTVEWADPVEGCFGLGEYAGRHSDTELNDNEIFGCNSSDGTVDSLSVSGAHREIISVEEADRRYYHLGVMAWSMYEYSNVKFELRVLSDGKPVEDIELREEWWPEHENPPRDLEDLLVFDFTTPLQVWRFGVWDAEQNRLLPYPRARFDTRFPSSP